MLPMHTPLNRLNAVSGFMTSVIMVLISLVTITSFITPHNLKPGTLNVTKFDVKYGRGQSSSIYAYAYGHKSNYARLTYDLNADLTPLFDWNTKQLFLYLYADYPSNRVVIWDRIVRRKRDAKVRINGGKNKYSFKDPSDRFPITNVTLKLGYDVMPYTGLLWSGVAAESTSIPIPRPSK